MKNKTHIGPRHMAENKLTPLHYEILMYHGRGGRTGPLNKAPATLKYTKQLLQAGYLEYTTRGEVGFTAEGRALCLRICRGLAEVLADVSKELN